MKRLLSLRRHHYAARVGIFLLVAALITGMLGCDQPVEYTPMVAAGGHHTVGLKSDGTVVAVGRNDSDECDVGGWTDIVQVAAGYDHTVGLKSDGTVVAAGDNFYGQCDVGAWTGITQVAATGMYGGWGYTWGLKEDRSVVAVPDYLMHVSNWTDIVQLAAGSAHMVGLKSDGTVVAVGENAWGQCELGGWTDIVQVTGGTYHTVGLKSDGTVVAAGCGGIYDIGQCNIDDWDLS